MDYLIVAKPEIGRKKDTEVCFLLSTFEGIFLPHKSNTKKEPKKSKRVLKEVVAH